ncbi:uncharacterized protein BXZ73DRAFT_77470 [Epithele typhae]|uniref:uncharacterized protein n=1 Tax=Epithele typhae TaxID=378194 RepID=UPI002007E4A5|nr:uncharacterized protein BXZ73DRAFT_77470 [Epithele typhae]KAH9932770.1 hypothetical protein BXZ73DRAFT_77470 [Epithele typhae]
MGVCIDIRVGDRDAPLRGVSRDHDRARGPGGHPWRGRRRVPGVPGVRARMSGSPGARRPALLRAGERDATHARVGARGGCRHEVRYPGTEAGVCEEEHEADGREEDDWCGTVSVWQAGRQGRGWDIEALAEERRTAWRKSAQGTLTYSTDDTANLLWCKASARFHRHSIGGSGVRIVREVLSGEKRASCLWIEVTVNASVARHEYFKGREGNGDTHIIPASLMRRGQESRMSRSAHYARFAQELLPMMCPRASGRQTLGRSGRPWNSEDHRRPPRHGWKGSVYAICRRPGSGVLPRINRRAVRVAHARQTEKARDGEWDTHEGIGPPGGTCDEHPNRGEQRFEPSGEKQALSPGVCRMDTTHRISVHGSAQVAARAIHHGRNLLPLAESSVRAHITTELRGGGTREAKVEPAEAQTGFELPRQRTDQSDSLPRPNRTMILSLLSSVRRSALWDNFKREIRTPGRRTAISYSSAPSTVVLRAERLARSLSASCPCGGRLSDVSSFRFAPAHVEHPARAVVGFPSAAHALLSPPIVPRSHAAGCSPFRASRPFLTLLPPDPPAIGDPSDRQFLSRVGPTGLSPPHRRRSHCASVHGIAREPPGRASDALCTPGTLPAHARRPPRCGSATNALMPRPRSGMLSPSLSTSGLVRAAMTVSPTVVRNVWDGPSTYYHRG